jgi:hypothetical protein
VLDAPYYRLDGQRIVSRRDALIDTESRPLESPINIDELGTVTRNTRVWTGTDPKGSSSDSCQEWSAASVDHQGLVGDPTQTGPTWTATRTSACSTSAALYCFQVEDPR